MVKVLSASLRRRLASFGLREEFQPKQDVTTKHPHYRYHVSVCRLEAEPLLVFALQCSKTVHTLQSFLTQKTLREEMGLWQVAIKTSLFSFSKLTVQPISVAARSKARVYGRPLAGIVGSNLALRMDACVECCQVDVSATG